MTATTGRSSSNKGVARRKSGRFWKSERDRFKSVIKTKGIKQSYEQKKMIKEAQKKAKVYEQSLKDATKQKKVELRMRQEENQKKRLENQRKTEVVQQVSKTQFNCKDAGN